MAIVSVRQAGLGGFTKNRRLSYTFPSTMGMVLLSPTSIAFSGTSASIGANGQVTFTAVTSLSLNGVFSATYDNYVISYRSSSSINQNLRFRLRASGTDNSTANSYTGQFLEADNTAIGASRASASLNTIAYITTSQRSGLLINMYGPYLAQPTAWRTVLAGDASSAYILDYASTHNQSTAYDGFSIYLDSGNITGALQVYGVRG